MIPFKTKSRQLFIVDWKEFGHDLTLYFPIFILLNLEVYNIMSKLESQISSYRLDIEFIIFVL